MSVKILILSFNGVETVSLHEYRLLFIVLQRIPSTKSTKRNITKVKEGTMVPKFSLQLNSFVV